MIILTPSWERAKQKVGGIPSHASDQAWLCKYVMGVRLTYPSMGISFQRTWPICVIAD